MTVSGHRSETSIKNYAQTSDHQKVNMSHTISSALGVDLDLDPVQAQDLDLQGEEEKFDASTSNQPGPRFIKVERQRQVP